MTTQATSGLSQQNQQLIAQIVSIAGMVAGTLGWAPPETIAGLTTNILAAIGPITTAVGLIWSLLASRKASIVSEVAAMPEVKTIQLERTTEGRALESVTPSNVAVTPPSTGVGPGHV